MLISRVGTQRGGIPMTTPDSPTPPSKSAKNSRRRDRPDNFVQTPANDAGEIVFEGPFTPVECTVWAKYAYWSVSEAGCITCGYEPGPLHEASFEDAAINPEAFRNVLRRIELFDREAQAGNLIDKIAPIHALEFLDAMDEYYPPDLKKTAERFRPYGAVLDLGAQMASVGKRVRPIDGTAISSSESVQGTQSSQTKVIQTLERMLLAISTQHLKFDPDRPQNPPAKLIQKAMGNYWKNVPHLDTIRSRLNAAVERHWEGPLDE